MNRPKLADLERTCQKPDHRRLGNWMARRIARPMALRVTWVVAPWGVSANLATLLAWANGVAAAIAFAWGTVGGWLLGAGLLQLWYLLDHVDGQLARLHGTSSLDGMQLDYLMHHSVDLLVPLGLGHGAFVATGDPVWLWVGVVWGTASLLIALQHDTRYKAFVTRLKRVRGRLEVDGGGGDRPKLQPTIPRRPIRLAAWLVRKACEPHVVMNLLTSLGLAMWFFGNGGLWLGRVYLAGMAATTAAVGLASIVRSQRDQTAEREFAAWYRPALGHELVYHEGWWMVEAADDREDAAHGADRGD